MERERRPEQSQTVSVLCLYLVARNQLLRQVCKQEVSQFDEYHTMTLYTPTYRVKFFLGFPDACPLSVSCIRSHPRSLRSPAHTMPSLQGSSAQHSRAQPSPPHATPSLMQQHARTFNRKPFFGSSSSSFPLFSLCDPSGAIVPLSSSAHKARYKPPSLPYPPSPSPPSSESSASPSHSW